MARYRLIRVPQMYYDEAYSLKRKIQREKAVSVPLWRCMMANELGKRGGNNGLF